MDLADRDGVIWMDGKMVPWRDATVHVLTHTLHYGVGVFEGIRAYKTAAGKTAAFRLDAHIDRLFDSAHILGMKMTYPRDELLDVCLEIVRQNGFEEAYIRPMCFFGSEGLGLHADKLKVHAMVASWEWGAYLGDDALTKGIRVKTSSFTRYHSNSVMCKAKANGNYLNSILALQEAMASGYDEALFLDAQGYVAEGSGENFFIVKNGAILTPELTAALDGITRDSVITLAREAGYSVAEKRITRDEVYIADEAFFTGTAAEVTPIRELDNRRIGEGSIGPITAELQSLYFDQVHGKRAEHSDWSSEI
jgi:branched-chain amino acid aminotransferase